jgi:hypothetical protein
MHRRRTTAELKIASAQAVLAVAASGHAGRRFAEYVPTAMM